MKISIKRFLVYNQIGVINICKNIKNLLIANIDIFIWGRDTRVPLAQVSDPRTPTQ